MAAINFNVAAFDASKKINYQAINQELISKSDSLLKSWFPLGKRVGKEFVVGNLNGDKGDSLSVNTETGIWKDFSTGECGSDLVSLYAAIHGIHQSEAASDLTDGKPPKAIPYTPPVFKPTPVKNRTWVSPTPWKATHECVHSSFGKPSNRWQYLNEQGKLIGYVARYETAGGKKQFCPWTFNGQDWVAKKWPSYQPFYGMDILAARPHDPVLIVEGEKACDAARRICGDEYVCITWPGGANAFEGPDWSMLADRNVLLWPDADKPGTDAMAKVRELISSTVTNIAVLDVSSFPEKWDAADALADGWVTDRFNQFVAEQFSGSSQSESVTPIKPVDFKAQEPTKQSPPLGVLQIPGMLGKVVEWSMHTARKPQAIYSVAAALALGSVLMGRRYQTSMNNWPSLYFIAIGRSATGKEHIKSTIEGLLEASGLDALLGPSKYTSESGVVSALIEKPTHIHITDELGMQLESSNKDKSGHYRDISKIEMECFGRLHGTLNPVGYSTAGMSKQQKDEMASRKVLNPALTIMAMTTPITFYDAIGSKALRDGFLNRFIVMECHAEREAGQFCTNTTPPQEIVDWCKKVRQPILDHDGKIDVAHDVKTHPTIMDIDPEAMSVFRDFEDFALSEMNRLDRFGLAEMWGRANEISMRLSMIIAVSCESESIKKEHAQWSVNFVKHFTNESVVSSGINITENAFDAAIQDIMVRIKEAGKDGLSRKQLRETSRKFKALTYSGQNDALKLLLEDGEFLSVERKKIRGPATIAFVFSEFAQ